jgi:VanZ family protein
MAFLGKIWPAFGKLFNAAFSPAWTHIAMHTFLYAILGFLLAQWIRPDSVKAIIVLSGFALIVGFLHESLQILSAGAWPGWPAEVLDLSVDLIGAFLGFLFAIGVSLRKNRAPAMGEKPSPK